MQRALFGQSLNACYSAAGKALGLFRLGLLFQDQRDALAGNRLDSMPPVPAGISRPTMTFSFRPSSVSALPLTAASVSTRVVSWNEAAEMKLRVCRLALVIPSRTGTPVAGSLPSAQGAR